MVHKQVEIRTEGFYHFCPHCHSKMIIIYKNKYCPDCGGGLVWDDVREYENIRCNNCPNEDSNNYCRYYNKRCTGSIDCKFVDESIWLKYSKGRLTSSEKEKLYSEKGWK